MNEILKILKEKSEPTYAEFTKKLVPDTEYKILGVRVPVIKNIAKKLKDDKDLINSFLSVKHEYYEEYFLHALLIPYLSKYYSEIIDLAKDFLPFIDNWAICDSFAASLKILKKNPEKTYEFVKFCFASDRPYTIRFGVDILIFNFTDKLYCEDHVKKLLKIKTDNYYVNMAIAWYLSVLAVKRFDDILPYFKAKVFSKFIHNKAISKSIDSLRIDENKKSLLKTLKI